MAKKNTKPKQPPKLSFSVHRDEQNLFKKLVDLKTAPGDRPNGSALFRTWLLRELKKAGLI